MNMMNEKNFITGWVKNNGDSIRVFPQDFLGELQVSEITMPGSRLNLGSELFGSFEIIDSRGNTFLNTKSPAEAKYFIYASRSKPKSIFVPQSLDSIQTVVSSYEKYLDRLIKSIINDYNKQVAEGKNQDTAVNQVFYQLDLVRF